MPAPTHLPAELTIYTAAQARLRCMQSLGGSQLPEAAPWRIDASAVQDIDAAGVQLLLSLQKALAASGRTLELTGASDALAAACAALGARSLTGATKAGT